MSLLESAAREGGQVHPPLGASVPRPQVAPRPGCPDTGTSYFAAGLPALGSDPMVSRVPPGQFLSRDARLTAEPSRPPFPKAGEPAETVLKVRGHQVPVVWKQRKIYNGEEQVDCWFARSNAAKLIDGEYRDYLASHPFDAQTSFGPRPSSGL